MADVTWIHVVIETPSDHFATSAEFWAGVTDSSSVPTGNGFRVLQPAAGSPYLSVRSTDRLRWSVSLVLETNDAIALRERAFEAGARPAGDDGLRSPGDFRFDIVPAVADRLRPPPVTLDGTSSRLDQVCIDCPPLVFEAELDFWSSLTGWDVARRRLPEFALLEPAADPPVRLVLQELGEGHRGRRARAHLDLACGGDVPRLIGLHEHLGATRGRQGLRWHTMSDPAGLAYCLTERHP